METGKLLKAIKDNIGVIGIVFVAALMRIFPHPPNFAPIGALALFSGANFKTKRAFLLPLSAMFLSDIIIGLHDTMIFVYGSFFLIAFLGRFLKKVSPIKLFDVSLLSSLLFFLITNFGVWLVSDMYSKNAGGLFIAYLLGLPFLRNTIIGDIVYSFTFFYGYELFNVFLLRTHKLKV